MNDQFLISIK